MAGYIGTTPVPQATQHRESFTATGGQTSFATAGYTPQFIDVYLNGVKLAPADYTATNGSDVVLASGATASDILEIVAYTPFEVANQTFTGDTSVTNLAVTGTFTSRGIDDNADAVAITIDSSENVGIGQAPTAFSGWKVLELKGGSTGSMINFEDSSSVRVGAIAFDDSYALRLQTFTALGMTFETNNSEAMRLDSSGNLLVGTTNVDIGSATSGSGFSYKASNGALQIARQASSATKPALVLNTTGVDSSILDFRKDGTTVGSIGIQSTGFYVDGESGHAGVRFGGDTLTPRQNGADADDAINLGQVASRFKDLYLSGGVYLGGTGAANKLDDYEEGTWTPTLKGGTSAGSASYLARFGWYTKIGNIVQISMTIAATSVTGTGNMIIDGLPFTTGSGSIDSVFSFQWNACTWSGPTAEKQSIIPMLYQTNNTTIGFRASDYRSSYAHAQVQLIGSGAITYARITGTYRIGTT